MKANELMIGDWVNYRGICNRIAPADFCQKAWIDEIEPIPLTPEILEKNGFKQIGKKFIWGEIDDDLIEIIPSINNSYRITVSVADLMISCSIWCSHVHQLQHALRLCKIEKEIIL